MAKCPCFSPVGSLHITSDFVWMEMKSLLLSLSNCGNSSVWLWTSTPAQSRPSRISIMCSKWENIQVFLSKKHHSASDDWRKPELGRNMLQVLLWAYLQELPLELQVPRGSPSEDFITADQIWIFSRVTDGKVFTLWCSSGQLNQIQSKKPQTHRVPWQIQGLTAIKGKLTSAWELSYMPRLKLPCPYLSVL